MTPLREMIARAVDRLGDDLEKLSHRIHDNPELGYQETKAAAWLTEFLDTQGFTVERGVGGVETAFRATLGTGEGPTIAILCEYDALPQIGHACGHNVIATAGVGAGAGLAAVRDRLPRGRIQVIGTRSEEHTSELQSQSNLVCRLLLEKKKIAVRRAPPTYAGDHETTRQMESRHNL